MVLGGVLGVWEGVKWGGCCAPKNISVSLQNQVQKKRRAGKFRGEGNRSCGLWMNPLGLCLVGSFQVQVFPSLTL